MTKADQAAAERLLKAAVKRAAADLRDADKEDVHTFDGRIVKTLVTYDRGRIVDMLRAAGESAELLLGEASRG